jgi:hypothetical protein
MAIRILDILSTLPEEAQRWIKGMNSGERTCTEIILNNVGEQSFVKHWRHYKDDLDAVRNF